MATPTQAQLTEERAAIAADLADKQSLYNSMIAKGQVNSAKEVLESINVTKSQLSTVTNQISNYSQFSAERASQDAQIAKTANFESAAAPANNVITSTSVTGTTTGGNQTTTTIGASSLTPEAQAANKAASLRASAFTANPSGKFGNSTIDRAVASGAITAEEAAALKAGSISEADRAASANAARQAGQAASSAGTVQTPATTTTVTPTPNSAGETAVSETLVANPAIVTSQSNPTNNTTTVTNIDGTVSEVTVNPIESTSTITPVALNELSQSTETTITVTETSTLSDPTGVLAAEDAALAASAAAADDAEAFRQNEPIADPYGVLAAEDAALEEEAAAAGDVEAFRQNEPIADPYGVLAAEEAALAEEAAAAGDAEAFTDMERNGRPIDDPYGVLAAEDAAIAEERAAADDAAAFRQNEPVDDPYGVLAAEDAAIAEEAAAAGDAAAFNSSSTNVVGSTSRALTSNPAVTVTPYKQDDWRIRLSLAGSADYLYKIASKSDVLYPLIATDGVLFPYSPQINTSYRANYDPAELTHSNYKMFFYKNSSVDDISITADFTAQDTAEANYMLAVIHFFKSATKMFYGQDTSPRAGTPPPLLYLTGYGLHQFQKHPLLLTSFSYNLPNDVDYIRAGSNSQWGGVSIAQLSSGSKTRLGSSGLTPGGVGKPAAFSGLASQDKVTYVPTKISLSLTLVPVVTRNDISKNFSLKDYAAGKLSAKTGGGIW